jgi:two-component system KDP operon response regulator KdpE
MLELTRVRTTPIGESDTWYFTEAIKLAAENGPEAKVLVVDDEAAVRRALHRALYGLGFDVGEAASGEEALALCQVARYDAVLLDIEMPGKKGVEICAELRHRWPRIPILMLSVTDDEERKLEAFDAGADDYLNKPVRVRELIARLRATLRRARQPASEGESIQIGEVKLNRLRRVVQKRDQVVRLTPHEFELLHYLMSNAGVPATYSSLLKALGNTESSQVDYVRALVYQLRKKLEDDFANPRYLLTDARIGYRFVSPAD